MNTEQPREMAALPDDEVSSCWQRGEHAPHRWDRILGGWCWCPGTVELVGDYPRIDSVRITRRKR